MDDRDDTSEWLEHEILRLVALHERRGGAPLSLLLSACDPDPNTQAYARIQAACPPWLVLRSQTKHREIRTMLNSMVDRARIRTTDEDAILYLQKLLNNKHAPEPVYLPINPLDTMAESLRRDDCTA